jgi:hypothetical protein
MHLMLCQAVAEVLGGAELRIDLSKRAYAQLHEARAEHPWVEMGSTALIHHPSGAIEWWNFAGCVLNASMAEHLHRLGLEASGDHFSVTVKGNADIGSIRSDIARLVSDAAMALDIPLAMNMLSGLKFSECVPDHLLTRMLASRMDQTPARKVLRAQRVRAVHVPS